MNKKLQENEIDNIQYNIYILEGENGAYNSSLVDTVDSIEQAEDKVAELRAETGSNAYYKKIVNGKELDENKNPGYKNLNEDTENEYEVELNKGAVERTPTPNTNEGFSGTREDLMEYLDNNLVDCTTNEDDKIISFEDWVKIYENDYDPSGSAVVLKITENGKEIYKNSDYDEYMEEYEELEDWDDEDEELEENIKVEEVEQIENKKMKWGRRNIPYYTDKGLEALNKKAEQLKEYEQNLVEAFEVSENSRQYMDADNTMDIYCAFKVDNISIGAGYMYNDLQNPSYMQIKTVGVAHITPEIYKLIKILKGEN